MPQEPCLYSRPPVTKPAGNWLKRALVAMIVERRLPYRVSVALDRLCNLVGLRRKTVTANGFKVRVRRLTCDELFVQNVLLGHEYTPDGFDIHELDIVIDIGGNIGTFALLASKHALRGKVFTFEPNSENYELLLQNIDLNKATNIIPVRAAVSGSHGKLKLFCSAEGGYHSVLQHRMSDPAKYELVDSLTLKAIFDDYDIQRCNFLKLDCEGAEYDILYNLPIEYFARIDKIAMEYHGDRDSAKRRDQSNALASYLEKAGFRIVAYYEFTGFRGGFIRAMRSRA
jgi:FkbM family methyltransferase